MTKPATGWASQASYFYLQVLTAMNTVPSLSSPRQCPDAWELRRRYLAHRLCTAIVPNGSSASPWHIDLDQMREFLELSLDITGCPASGAARTCADCPALHRAWRKAAQAFLQPDIRMLARWQLRELARELLSQIEKEPAA